MRPLHTSVTEPLLAYIRSYMEIWIFGTVKTEIYLWDRKWCMWYCSEPKYAETHTKCYTRGDGSLEMRYPRLQKPMHVR